MIRCGSERFLPLVFLFFSPCVTDHSATTRPQQATGTIQSHQAMHTQTKQPLKVKNISALQLHSATMTTAKQPLRTVGLLTVHLHHVKILPATTQPHQATKHSATQPHQATKHSATQPHHATKTLSTTEPVKEGLTGTGVIRNPVEHQSGGEDEGGGEKEGGGSEVGGEEDDGDDYYEAYYEGDSGVVTKEEKQGNKINVGGRLLLRACENSFISLTTIPPTHHHSTNTPPFHQHTTIPPTHHHSTNTPPFHQHTTIPPTHHHFTNATLQPPQPPFHQIITTTNINSQPNTSSNPPPPTSHKQHGHCTSCSGHWTVTKRHGRRLRRVCTMCLKSGWTNRCKMTTFYTSTLASSSVDSHQTTRTAVRNPPSATCLCT